MSPASSDPESSSSSPALEADSTEGSLNPDSGQTTDAATDEEDPGVDGALRGDKGDTENGGPDDGTIEVEQDSNPDSSETFPCPENTPPACATPPVLFVHGFLASGDTFSRHSMLYQRNGFLPSQIHVHDWDSFDQEKDHSIELDQHIDAILDSTECEQLILMGHSAGGGLSVSYLESAEQAAKVSHYVHIGSFGLESLPSPITPTLVVWSPADTIVPFDPESDLPACAVDGRLEGQDHYAVATSDEAFELGYTFVTGSSPEVSTLENLPSPQTHQGRVITLGSNIPVTANLAVTPFDPISGQKAEPIWEGVSDENGRFEGISLPNPLPLEFRIEAEGQLPLRYYREAQAANNNLLYMRTLGGGDDTVSALLSFLLKPSQDSATLVIFSAHRALVAGEDSLTVNGTEVLTEDTASASNTSIALFFQDTDGNGEDGGTDPALDAFPFFSGLDLFLPAGELATLNFNGKTFRLPLEASETGGITILVLE